MPRMGIHDQVKSAIQDIVAPALHEMRGEIQAMHADIRRLDQKIDGVDTRLSHKIDGVDARLSEKIGNLDARLSDRIDSLAAQMSHMKGELIAEIRRVDARIDGVDRELRTAIDIRERLAALEARRA
jgi:flagellar capping protein FliD